MNTPMTPRKTADPAEIVKLLRLVLEPGQVTELRALEATLPGDRYPQTISGYFDDAEKLAEAVASIVSAKGIYFTPNPVNSALLARAANRIRPVKKEPTTADHDITRRRWLLGDVDPVRPAGISSTDSQHDAAIERVHAAADVLCSMGWPRPILVDSGNGAQFMYRIDLPADDDGLVKRVLAGLAAMFDTEDVKVDVAVFNPARIWKLPGTWACKGDDTPDRPHRLARIIEAPAELEVVTLDQLNAMAAAAPGIEPSPKTTAGPMTAANHGNGQFDLAGWIAKHNLDVTGPKQDRGGQLWVFKTCPWNSDHTNGSAFVGQMANGAMFAGCKHNGCKGKDWHALRDAVEPGWREQRRASVSSVSPPAPVGANDWPDPQPLPAGLPDVLPFDFDLLPAALHQWIKDITDRMQCPPDYCAAPAIIMAGMLIGRKVAIRPKRHDDWTVVPNLYGVIVGRPGAMKSPPMKEVLKPLQRLEIEAKEKYQKDLLEHETAKLVGEAKKKVQKDQLKKAVEEGGDAQAIAKKMVRSDPTAPVRRRYIVNNSTVEKLGVILAENTNGVLTFEDELISLLRTMDREGHESDRGFYLAAWEGNLRYVYDRIGRGTLDIEAAILSLVGSITPAALGDYLFQAVNGGKGDDGLIQRLQIAVWPDVSSEWRNVDRYPDAEAKERAYAALHHLNDLTANSVRCEHDERDPNALPFLRFDHAAQELFDTWRANHEMRLRSGADHQAIESHLAKYRSLVPSLALILHLLDGGSGPVSAPAVKKAIGWARYLESHARRLYAGVTEAPAVAARLLARKIESGDVQNGFVARDVYRHGWTGLDKDRTEAALDVLVPLHWLEEHVEPTPGRTRTRYSINPKIAICSKKELTKLPEAPSGSSVSAPAEEKSDSATW